MHLAKDIRFSTLLFVLVAVTLMTCKRDSDKVSPVVDPRILNMRIDGIPQTNIVIDQDRKQITVTLPDKFGAYSLRPTYELTPNSQIVNQEGYPIAGEIGLIVTDTTLQQLRVATISQPSNSSASVINEYKVKISQTGSLRVKLVPEPGFNEYKIGDGTGFLIVAENFYDDPRQARVILTKKGGPEAGTIVQSGDAAWSGIQLAGASPTEYPVQYRVFMPADTNLLPGEYTVALQESNGQTAVSTDVLLVKKGTIKLGVGPLGLILQRSVAGNEVTINGINLFEDSNLEVQLKHLDGTVVRRKPVRYNTHGTQLIIAPGDIKPGHYVMQVLVNGQAALDCYRLAVTRTEEQPYITYFGNSNPPSYYLNGSFCEPNSPQVVIGNSWDGGRMQFFCQTPSIASGDDRLTTLKLQPVDASQPAVELSIYTGIFAYPISFPTSIKAGQYRMTLVVTDKKTQQTYESEPFERLIEIR